MVAVLAVAGLSSCRTTEPSKDYQNALAIYQQTIDLEVEVRAIKRSLEQVVAQDTGLSVYSSELESITAVLDQWESDVLNLPEANTELLGHNHPEKTGLSDQEILEVQTELSERLGALSARLESLMDKMSD